MSAASLEQTALNVREKIISLSTNGGCFLGASLSAVEIVISLYEKFLNIPKFDDPNRDYFFLSKGHDVPALYSYYAEKSWIENKRLQNHLSTNDSIYWHPNRNIPGVEFHSGSLGHLLSVAIGVALDMKWKKTNNRCVVLVGDGELNEGSNWEALLVANAYQVNNLLIVVDRNHFQANVRTEELIPLEPLEDKFLSFGATPKRINGHDFNAFEKVLSEFPFSNKGPSVIIADTIRGKGLPSIEERADRWFCNFTQDEVAELQRELKGNYEAKLKSETLVVR